MVNKDYQKRGDFQPELKIINYYSQDYLGTHPTLPPSPLGFSAGLEELERSPETYPDQNIDVYRLVYNPLLSVRHLFLDGHGMTPGDIYAWSLQKHACMPPRLNPASDTI